MIDVGMGVFVWNECEEGVELVDDNFWNFEGWCFGVEFIEGVEEIGGVNFVV